MHFTVSKKVIYPKYFLHPKKFKWPGSKTSFELEILENTFLKQNSLSGAPVAVDFRHSNPTSTSPEL